MDVKTEFNLYHNVYLEINRYAADDSLAISLYNDEYGPIINLTVCLVDPFLSEYESYVDINNFSKALDFIRTYKLGKETGKCKVSGYCRYPSVIFNIEELKKYSR